MKGCSRCKEIKPKSDFVKCKSKKDGIGAYCKQCHNEKNLKWKNENRKKHRLVSKIGTANLKYGLNREGFLQLLEQQDNKCPICGHEFDLYEEGKNLHVDHCHTTGEVRGLLCGKCNRGLGQFADNPQWLRNAAEYLERNLCLFKA